MPIPDQESAPTEIVVAPPEDLELLRSKAAELDQIRAELDKQKLTAAETIRKQQEEAAKNGELKTAYEIAQRRLAELENLAPLAAKYQQYESNELKRIEEEAKQLPEQFQKLFNSAKELDQKRDILSAFQSTKPTNSPKVVEAPPATGTPPLVNVIDFDAAFSDQKKFEEAKKADPTGFSAWLAKHLGPRNNLPLGVKRFDRAQLQK